MVSDESIEKEFEEFSIKIEDVALLDKLKEICIVCHFQDASDLVEEWIAYATSVRAGDHDPTLVSLEEFQRRKISDLGKRRQISNKYDSTSKVTYNKDTLDELMSIDEDDEDLMGSYQTPSNKVSTKRPHTTPEAPLNKRHLGIGRSPAPFSPASFSPASMTPSAKYGSRTNSGDMVCSYKPSESNEPDMRKESATEVVVQPIDASQALESRYSYMFQKQADKCYVLNDMIEQMREKIQKCHGIEEFDNLSTPVQEEISVVGRVCCDANGKLNAHSVILEGSQDSSGGQTVKLDLSEISQFALFPGQIIAAKGLNNTGKRLVARTLFEGVKLPFYLTTEKGREEAAISTEPFTLLVCAGPYTTSDSLSYEPLVDLINVVQRDKPDLLVLLGPFVDSKNSVIENGGLEETFKELFEKQVEQIIRATERLRTTVVFVPSWRDVHHDCVYPQPPFTTGHVDQERVHFVSDPCTLVINGVVIGLTSSDILLHLGSEETASPPGSSDRLSRLVKHILYQHNYYPLNPPAEEINLDYERFAKHASFPFTPDILVLPSDLRYFAKDVLGCLCVNPGRLAKGHVGGTYSMMKICPNPSHTDPVSSHILARSVAKVIRI